MGDGITRVPYHNCESERGGEQEGEGEEKEGRTCLSGSTAAGAAIEFPAITKREIDPPSSESFTNPMSYNADRSATHLLLGFY